MFQSDSEAIAVLNQPELDTLLREDAVHYLGHHLSPRGLESLVQALEDDEFGVRWAAAVALSQQGEAALPTLLRALMERGGDSPLLREGAYHVLHYNASATVHALSQELMQALKGPAAGISAAEAAYKLLQKLQQNA